MAWMSNEQYMMVSDSKEKKSVAASAFKQRTHCGKGGGVKLPCDYLSKKELRAMNGECVKYASLKKPMTWEEFKTLPDDLKKEYIKKLREKFNIPDTRLADALGASRATFRKYTKCLGLSQGKSKSAEGRWWDDTEFNKWWNGESSENASVEPLEAVETENTESIDIPVDNAEKVAESDSATEGSVGETKHAVPNNGTMTFTGNIDDVLRTVHMLLDGNNVGLTVSWHVIEE